MYWSTLNKDSKRARELIAEISVKSPILCNTFFLEKMAMILDAFAGRMVDRLAEFVEEKVVTVLGVKDELKKLQQRMERIKHVLQDAERKRIQSELIAGWVGELKDVVYDVDDIIDLCRFGGGKLLGDQPSKSSEPSTVRCNFSSMFSCFTGVCFRHEIGGRIKKLNERLDDIYKETPNLNLLQNEPDVQVSRVNPRQTSSVVDLSDIVGGEIQRASENLIELIVKKDEQRCRVIAVTGMGGIGKTTLAQNIFAQNIFNHQSEFIKIWVCISQNFSETGLLKEIIRGAVGKHEDAKSKELLTFLENAESKEELLTLLKTAVSGKHIFLVLDDVWRADVWVSLLRSPLQSGALTSRVLVTTRDQNVALQMRAAHIHPIQLLTEASGWELLCRCIFVNDGEEEMQSLGDVGIEIVKKCHGLPLAIKTIAGVLTTKERRRGEWEKVLRRDAWSMDNLPEDLRGALYLSYEDLPSHLKQCFLFCSLFPEDFKFSSRELVKYWVVEGFVETQKDYSFLESADEYFEELVRRNLIQKADTRSDNMFYKMHDILRSLAQFLSREECFCGEADKLTKASTTTSLRRLTITNKGELEVIPGPLLLKQKSLRTLFLTSYPRFGDDLFVKFSCLRVLVLRDSGIENIPEALGNLIHLRLLDLDRTKISSLPKSIRCLTNLQVLNLSGCRSLHTLPKGITQLCNLWFIDFHETPLHFMPAGIGKLEQLHIFNGFVVGENSIRSRSGKQQQQGCDLEDLRPLLLLRELSMHILDSTVAQKGQLVLRDKPHLKHLELSCSTSTNSTTAECTEEEIHKTEGVFAELFPPPCLERLEINGYFGSEFPSWMVSASLGTSLPQLRNLSLSTCRLILKLPPLGLLHELRSLEIQSIPRIESMGPEFLGTGSTSVSFPKLEVLRIRDLQNLQEWSFCEEDEDLSVLPHLQDLIVDHCPKLESLPRGLKKSPLKILFIQRSGLKEIDNFQHLTVLGINGCQSLERISDLPALEELMILDCGSLKCVDKVDGLERLNLDYYELDCLPEWLLTLLQQRQQYHHQDDNFYLRVWCTNDSLLKRCLEGCEYWPIIQSIPRVEIFAENGNKYLFYSKKPFVYNTNL